MGDLAASYGHYYIKGEPSCGADDQIILTAPEALLDLTYSLGLEQITVNFDSFLLTSDYCERDVIVWTIEVRNPTDLIESYFFEREDEKIEFYTIDENDIGLYEITVIAEIYQ